MGTLEAGGPSEGSASGGLRVGVVGAAGRMGQRSCGAIQAQQDMTLAAAIDRHPAPAVTEGPDAVGRPAISTQLGHLLDQKVQVVLDFTAKASALKTARFCAGHNICLVIGASGFGPREIESLRETFSDSEAACLLVPNFAIGAVLMMRFAQMAAPWFDTAEIIEMHHDGKLDAPSGTAMNTSTSMAAARQSAGRAPFVGDITSTTHLEGARGASGQQGPRIHSVRLRGLVAHQEVLLGGEGEGLTIRHDSFDRSSFMPGVLLALRSVSALHGLTVGLDSLLQP